jgi:hypothetical protein
VQLVHTMYSIRYQNGWIHSKTVRQPNGTQLETHRAQSGSMQTLGEYKTLAAAKASITRANKAKATP